MMAQADSYLGIVFSTKWLSSPGTSRHHITWRSFHPEGENHEDASCCCHSCDGDGSPRRGEGEAVARGPPPAGLSVGGAPRLFPRLPSEGLVPRRFMELLIFGGRLVGGLWCQ